MLLKSIRRMYGLRFEGRWRWTHYFLPVTWLLFLAFTPPKALGYFLGDTKAVLHGCEDHWTLQDRAAMPLLFQMTVCVNIRVVVPGAWVAFSYSSVHAPKPELGLEGDDEALYGWLLRVRHRFPLRLSSAQWHRVCLRRDVPNNSFSLEVDGRMVAVRTVIARAIPPSGSLWLGCRPRDRPPGAVLGAVELYLFRMWADLGNHGSCEDGTVIGWKAQYWGVTSAKARQRDPSLQCEPRRFRRDRRAAKTNSPDSGTTPGQKHFSKGDVPSDATTSLKCDISQLCSDKDAYYWMSINVDANGTEDNVRSLVSTAFSCLEKKTNHCRNNQQVKVVQVNCTEKQVIRSTTCEVILQLSKAVSACELQSAGESALQQAGNQRITASIIGRVERVGQDLCMGVAPSSGEFVTCTSPDLLEDICKANKQSELTCSLKKPHSSPAQLPETGSCSSEAPRFCDCTAFCNSASHFFATRININKPSVSLNFLRNLLSGLKDGHPCKGISQSSCEEISKHYQGVHLECHGTNQRWYSCMVIFEMSGPVQVCSLNTLLQELIDSNNGLGSERPLTRMVVCGLPGLGVHTLLASNLTWVASDLVTSDVCQPDPTLLKCNANENLAVLLTDSCPPTTTQSTMKPSHSTTNNLISSPQTLTPSVTNTTKQSYTTTEATALQGTAQPSTTTIFTTISSTQSSTAQPVFQNRSQNMPVAVSDRTTLQKTTFLTPTENAKLQNGTTANRNTTAFTIPSAVNSTVQITTPLTDSAPNTTSTVYKATTDTPSPNDTSMHNMTTTGMFTPSTNHTAVNNVTLLANNNKTEYNVTTLANNHTTEYNVTTIIPFPNDTTVYNMTTTGMFTPSTNHTAVNNVTTMANNHTTEYNITTITPFPNDTTLYNMTTTGLFTPSANHTEGYNVTTPASNHTRVYNATTGTPSPNNTTEYNVSTDTPSPTGRIMYNVTTVASNHTTEYNVTTGTPSPNNISVYNVTTANTFTPSTNHTAVNNVTTLAKNHTTEYNVTTITPFPNDTTIYNVTTGTPSPNDTTVYNMTIPSTNHTAVNNVTTVANNHTSEYNVTTGTPSPNNTTEYNVTTGTPFPHNTSVYNVTRVDTFTLSTNHTAVNNVTTVANNRTTEYNVTTVPSSPNDTMVYNMTTAGRFTPFTNHTAAYNVTTMANNYTTALNLTTITPFPNDTTVYNVTTGIPSPNDTTVYNMTTPSTNHTAVNNVTTVANNRTSEYNVTTRTPSPNNTTEYNATTVPSSSNDTMVYNMTTAGRFTPSTNNTAAYNVTTMANNYTTAFNVTTVTPFPNGTTKYSINNGNNRTLHNRTVTGNATISTFTPPPNYNVTTSNRVTFFPSPNHTVEYNVTTANYTTAKNISTTTVSQNKAAITSTKKNDTNSTTAAAPGISPTVDHNETTGVSFNLSSTASSLTTKLNQTTDRPEVNLTTSAADPSPEDKTTTLTTTTTTTHNPSSDQIDITTAKVTSTSSKATQNTILNSTTTVKPGPGTTSTNTPETTTSPEAQEEQANELLDQTQDVSQLNSSQVAQLVDQLENLLDAPTVSKALGQKAINVISNLMQGDLSVLSASANRLIRMVDDLGLKLVVTGDSEIVSANSLVLAVRTVDGTNFPETSVNIFNTDNVQLRANSRSRSKRSESALGSVFLPSSLTAGLSPEQQKQASRVQFTFYTKSALFQDLTLNQTLVSPVLGSSVANLSLSNLSENIQFTIRNINPLNESYAASCVFWNFTQNNESGGWSSAGCFVVNATPEDTTCSCSHLTSFAVLLDLSRDEIIDRLQAQVLTFITYIGCGISAIFLAVTLLTYLSFAKLLRDIPAKILVQLCMSLLLLNLVFLLDGWLALYPAVGLCISTAFFLHYFLLTSFTWAGLEALHMYLSIVQVFTPYLSRYMLKFTLMGWGIPLIVVIVVISVDKDNYGLVTYGRNTNGTTGDFCWLRNDVAFYVGVVAYFILIFALCLLVFIIVMVQLSRIKKQNPQNQSPNRGVMTDLRSIAGLIILLGLTWGFALFAWGPLYLPFVYLFTIFNSLQGFIIFVLHCAVKENVRRQWRTYLCCGRLRLAENSEWSRTATQNKNLSIATGTTSAPHFTSRSSSVISDGTTSSGSVFADSGISDISTSDVVLNELHRRNLSP